MGRPRAQPLRPADEPGQGKVDDLPRPEATGGIDDDDTDGGRDGQEVVDVELTDGPHADAVGQLVPDHCGSSDGHAVIAPVRRAAHQNLDAGRLGPGAG
jgi:hypothetical protein